MTYNHLSSQGEFNEKLDDQFQNCKTENKNNCKLKSGDIVRHKQFSFEGKVQQAFELLTERSIDNYAYIVVNNSSKGDIRIIVKADDLETSSPQKTEINDYFIVLRNFRIKIINKELAEGLIFCLIKDQKVANEFIIYSKDLDSLIPFDKSIIEELRNKSYFAKIDENIAKHLLPIMYLNDRLWAFKQKVDLIKYLQDDQYVWQSIFQNSLYSAFIHKKEEIGGCHLYLIHVLTLSSILNLKNL
jgi:hypothetical protein